MAVDPTGAFPGIFVTADGDRRLSVQLPPKLGRRPADTVIMLLSGWDTEVDSETYRTALVELVEQEGLRFMTNLVNCDPESVSIGMPVRVLFEDHGEIFVPVFEPDPTG